nr:MAG TPA: SOS-response transcriptional repressor [Caudoviricetes sp.]
MVNGNKLRAIIIERGMTQKIVAEKLGMAPKTFYSKVKKGVFGSDEINQMIDLLKIQDPMSIFFSR